MKEWLDFLISLIYPIRCSSCGDIINYNGFNLCNDCIKRLKIIENSCSKCGKELITNNIDICEDCRKEVRHFDKALSTVQYKDFIKYMLIQYKFYHRLDVEKTLIELLLLKAREFTNIDLVIGVPIHENRYKERGYNQSDRLAKGLAGRMGWIFNEKVLLKVKETQAQSQLNKKERLNNLINAYKVQNNQKIYNKNILLIDDIYTTGATTSECAKTLKEGGAKIVYVLTVASGEGY